MHLKIYFRCNKKFLNLNDYLKVINNNIIILFKYILKDTS